MTVELSLKLLFESKQVATGCQGSPVPMEGCGQWQDDMVPSFRYRAVALVFNNVAAVLIPIFVVLVEDVLVLFAIFVTLVLIVDVLLLIVVV